MRIKGRGIGSEGSLDPSKYMKQFTRKKHRLKPSCYIGFVRVTITICIKDKKTVFVKDKICNAVLKFLQEELQKERIVNWAYVFMSDHIHLVLEGRNEKSNILDAIKLFKQKSGFWLKHNFNTTWQESFYDHIHRKDDKLREHIKYIFENPVRKKIVKEFLEYRYLGSLDYKIEDII